MLYCIGLGLGSPEDITLRGLKAIQGCTRVYLEAYTSILVDVGFEAESETSGQQGRGIEHLVRTNQASEEWVFLLNESVSLLTGKAIWQESYRSRP